MHRAPLIAVTSSRRSRWRERSSATEAAAELGSTWVTAISRGHFAHPEVATGSTTRGRRGCRAGGWRRGARP